MLCLSLSIILSKYNWDKKKNKKSVGLSNLMWVNSWNRVSKNHLQKRNGSQVLLFLSP